MKATTRTAEGVEIIKLEGKITIGAGDTQLREVISNAVNAGKTNMALTRRSRTAAASSSCSTCRPSSTSSCT
jgi:hypothetical protein